MLTCLRAGVRASARAGILRRALCAADSSDVDVDYFAVLNTERCFDVERQTLAAAYKAQMVLCHPDRFAGASEAEQGEAQRRSAAVTHAYSVLRRPHSRASHLLQLLGAGWEHEPPSAEAAGQQSELVSMPFLMSVMEWREQIEEAAGCDAALAAVRAEVDGLVAHNTEQLGSAFTELLESDSDTDGENEALQEAQRLTAELQYLRRMEDEIKELSKPDD